MNKKEKVTEVKKLGGMRIIPNNSQHVLNEQGCLFDGFEGLILIYLWDTGKFCLIEGYCQEEENKTSYKTTGLGYFPEESLEDVENIQQAVDVIKKECIKMMEKHQRFQELGYPEIAMDSAIAQILEILEE